MSLFLDIMSKSFNLLATWDTSNFCLDFSLLSFLIAVFFLEINSCVLVCLDQERSAEMEHTKQQDRKKQMVFNKHWTGRARKLSRGSVCVSVFNENLK